MRRLLIEAGLLAVVMGCSSSDDNAPACTIAGTYDNTATIDQTSTVGCKDLPVQAKNTITVTKTGETTYDVGFTGLAGNCVATETETCKLQTKCDVVVARPTTDKTLGTYQAVLTFTSTGLTNLASVSLPPNETYPKGCSYRGSSEGERL